MTAHTLQGVTKRELLIFIYRYRQRLIRSFAIPFVLFLVLSFIPTPQYQASSILIVRLGSEYVYQPEVGNPGSTPSPVIPFSDDQISKSEVAILSSDDLHAQVIDAVGLDTLYPRFSFLPEEPHQERLTEAVETFDKHLDIELEKESAVIDISFEHKDREIAMKALSTLLTLYSEKRKELYLEPRAKLAAVEVEARRAQALQADRQVEAYKRTHKIYALDAQRTALLGQRSDAQKQAANISSPGLEQEIASYTHQLDQLDAEEREFDSLQREATIAQESYSLYSHKLDEAKAYENLEHSRVDSVRIIQPPTVPPKPKRLQLLIILAGLFLSILSALTTAAYTEFARRGFLAPEQIERSLGLSVLAVLPHYKRL